MCTWNTLKVYDFILLQGGVDRVSVLSPVAIDILMVRIGEGQSSHVLVFCVNFKLSEIISFI